ncbi:MAG: hydroxymethylglutaryl-CoA lyase [Pseudomonadota bacterium]
MAEHVTIFEVGPRDGLQNEPVMIAADQKIALVNQLSDCGFTKLEVTSFVSPKWVPQMADAAEVMAGITRAPGVAYAVLTPNMRGLEDALPTHPDEIAIFSSASEGFSRSNINCSMEESLTRFKPVIDAARAQGIPVRGYVSCVTDCPFDGPTPPANVAHMTRALLDMGCYEISLGDTIGAATPETISAMLDAVLDVAAPAQMAGHYHDTRGRALTNIEVSLERGLRVFDSSVGGLGGCPYAPSATGNVSTEAVVEMLEARGVTTGIDLDRLARVAQFAQSLRSAA